MKVLREVFAVMIVTLLLTRKTVRKDINPKPFPMVYSVMMSSVFLVDFDGSSSSIAVVVVIGQRQFRNLAYFVISSSSFHSVFTDRMFPKLLCDDFLPPTALGCR